MNRVISSWVVKLIALLGGYIAALSVVRFLSRPFNLYVSLDIGDFLRLNPLVSIPLFMVCAALLLISVWLSRGKPFWRNINILLLAVPTFCIIFLCVYFAQILYTSSLIPLSIIAYSVVMALLMECTARLSDMIFAEYDKANAEKVRAERFKTELITNVSHDIRTPLTSIINYIDLLKTLQIENTDFAEYVGVLDRKAARLKTLIDDLMEASKAGTGNMSVDLCEINLTEIMGQIAGEFDEQFAERGLTLVLRQPDQPVFTIADSRHLWRVLENLFGNAVKYSMPETRVFAEIILRDEGTVFTMKNTSKNHIDLSGDALTEQFMRGDRARLSEGSGLGLYIVKSLVELMGGRFAIHVTGDLFVVEVIFGDK